MKYFDAKRVASAGLASLMALSAVPLACGSSSGGDSPGGAGSVGSGTAGANASAGASSAGSPGAGASSAGAPSGTAGNSSSTAGQGQGDSSAGAGGASGGGVGGSAGDTGGSSGGGNTAGAAGTHDGAFDGSKCKYTNDKDFCACIGATCGGDTINDMSGGPQSVYCGQCAGTQTCVGFASDAGGALGTCQDLGGLTDAQKAQAAALTSIWENSTPVLAYSYAEDINDYRGITAGRAGFCTGTGDGIVVVQCISAVAPTNPLAKFVPAMIGVEKTFVNAKEDLKTAASNNKAGNLTGLDGYADAWKAEGNNADFKKCQDSVVDAVYYGPALKKARAKKFTKALTIVSLWDAQLEQGEADPTFGVVKMISMADAQVKLSDPPSAAEESAWLGAFHKIRATIMKNYPEWKDNNCRVATYEMIRLSGDMDFKNCAMSGAKSAADYWPGLSSAKCDPYTICTGGKVQ